MALSALIAWELRQTGNDTNSGGFKFGATGTDWSLFDTPQYFVIDGVTAGSTTITSNTANFGTDVVGNLIYVAGGTGSVTAGWYEITARTNATTITVDRSTGLSAGTGVTLRIGGALASLAALSAVMVTSNRAFLKSGAYSVSTNLTFPGVSGLTSPTPSAPATAIFGYATTRGDSGFTGATDNRPVITLSGSAVAAHNGGQNGWDIRNLTINCNSLAGSKGLNIGGYSTIENVKVLTPQNAGIQTGASATVRNCEIATPGGSYGMFLGGSNTRASNCNVHDGTATTAGIFADQGTVDSCIVANMTSATCDGISVSNTAGRATRNTVDRCGRDGILTIGDGSNEVHGNLLTNNGRYGLNVSGSGSSRAFDGNAYRNNSSGQISAYATGILALGAWTNARDVTLTADPYTNVTVSGGVLTNADYSLNNTAGGGAACRAVSDPSAFPGLASVGYPDFGAIQHQDSPSMVLNQTINRYVNNEGDF